MQIRSRLTLYFIMIVAIVMLLASVAIYFFSAGHRKEDFYGRLHNKATNTAMLLIEFEEVDLDLLKKIEADNPVSLPREIISIYDFRNQILYSTDSIQILKINDELLDEIRLKGEVKFTQDEYEILGFLFTSQYDRFVVITAGVDIFGWRKMVHLRNILLLVIAVSLLLFLVSGWIYAGKALKPISQIVSQVDEITISNLDKRLDEGNHKDELARLSGTFNKMLNRLETAFQSQKQFITNASHELKTPLTAITGQLEVVLMNDHTVDDYKKTITSVLDDIKGLNRISSRLLLLAQTSTEFPELNLSQVRIDEIIWQCRDYLMKRKNTYRINVLIDPMLDEDKKLRVDGDENLLRTMIINLMENGCKYSADHTVLVELKPNDEGIEIIFSDQGIGIHENDILQIFEPFRRGINSTGIKGHGIGLSLVDRIVNLHKGSVSVESVLNSGTTFKVKLPR
jgi:signal transduction histidine kinase